MRHGTGCTGNEGGTQRGEIGLLLRPVPPDDIRNITVIAKKLRRSVVLHMVIQEPFEFVIRAAHTVNMQCAELIEYAVRACSYLHREYAVRAYSMSSAGVPPYNRHTTAIQPP
jgi:hypothetical protein